MDVNGLNKGCPCLGTQVVSTRVSFHAFLLFAKKKKKADLVEKRNEKCLVNVPWNFSVDFI
jgi:hypothetical protein